MTAAVGSNTGMTPSYCTYPHASKDIPTDVRLSLLVNYFEFRVKRFKEAIFPNFSWSEKRRAGQFAHPG